MNLRARARAPFLLAVVLALVAGTFATFFSPPAVAAEPGEGTVAGYVRGTDGVRLAGVTVTAYEAGPDASTAPVATTTTEEPGEETYVGDYRLDLPAGTYRLEFSGEGLATRWYGTGAGEVIDVEDAGWHDLDPVTVSPASDAVVHGVTEDESGNRIDDVVVEAWAEGAASPTATARTYAGGGEGHGYFALYLPPGTYEIRYSARWMGYLDAVRDDEVTVAAGGSVDLGVLVLEEAPTATASGRVVDGSGNPLPGVRVKLRAAYEDGRVVRSGLTDSVGRYEIPGVPRPSSVVPCSKADRLRLCLGAVRPRDAQAVEVAADAEQVAIPDLVRDLTPVTARVTTASGRPVSGAILQALEWRDGAWVPVREVVGDTSGLVGVSLPAGTYTFRFLRAGLQPVVLGGGSDLPSAPGASGSVDVAGGAPLDLGAVALPRLVTTFGTPIAGEYGADSEYCLTEVLDRNDDSSAPAYDLPFDLSFFGQPYESVFVNNNGNVTFGDSLSDYTPGAFDGGDDYDGPPIIAPFFADVDTRGEGSNVVTFGANEAGTKFCVNWTDVGYYSSNTDKLNSFQLILTAASAGDREPGDFDIQFNYDQVLWETGDASDGEGGLGGTSALAGFTAGTPDVPGTVVQLPGSLVNGALLDHGPHALVAGTQNAGGRPGRYNFPVYNGEVAQLLGGLSGSVVDSSEPAAGVGGALVEPCRTVDGRLRCAGAVRTDQDGGFSFVGLVAGGYVLRVSPPAGSTLFPGQGAGTVVAGQDTALAEPIVLSAPRPVPTGVTVSNDSSTPGVFPPRVLEDGTLVMHYQAALDLRIEGCPGVEAPSVTFTVGGQTLSTTSLVEEPAGVYRATVPQPGTSGQGVIATNVPTVCDGEPVAFDVYIDPSGTITDQFGIPLDGAVATLMRSDTVAGPFTQVPNGSAIMSPSNRVNPDTTGEDGGFAWDVLAGIYRVDATSAGCADASTAEMAVPPERLALLIKMQCASASVTPETGPTVVGTPSVGSTLTVTPATWPGLIVPSRIEWRRGTTVVSTGSSYTPSNADAGQALTVRTFGKRPDYRQENLPDGDLVTFEEVVASTVTGPVTGGGTVTPNPTITNTGKPSVTGTAKVGEQLTADPGTWSMGGLAYAYQWLRGGTPVAGATGATYTATVDDLGKALSVAVTASRTGATPGTATSDPVTIAEGDAPANLGKPQVTGTPAVGETLTVSDGTWDLEGLTFTRQWLRDGEPVEGATGATYVVTEADQGSELTARVTASRPGHADGTVTADGLTVPEEPQEPAASTTKAKLSDKKVRRDERGEVTVRVTSAGGTTPTGTVTVEVGRRSVTAELVGGRARVELPKLKPGRYEVTVTYSGDEVTGPSSDDAGILRVQEKKRKDGKGGKGKGGGKGRDGTGRPLPALL